jgi:hypothetical protein
MGSPDRPGRSVLSAATSIACGDPAISTVSPDSAVRFINGAGEGEALDEGEIDKL